MWKLRLKSDPSQRSVKYPPDTKQEEKRGNVNYGNYCKDPYNN